MNNYLLFCLLFCVVMSARSEDVFVNKPSSDNDSRYDYPHRLLQIILDKTNEKYSKSQVKHTQFVMNRDRMLLSLVEGENLHVVAEAPKQEWLKKLRVIRIPIRKGIQGYRLFFINKEDQSMISNMSSLSEFMQLPTGSGVGWSTAKIMGDAGFKVVTGNNYDGLFDMLEKKRFLTLGRGINEILPEFKVHSKNHPSLAIESTLVVHIPLPTYFFVSPQKPLLAERIEKGLWEMVDTGEFDDFFYKYHRDMIENTNLKSRKVYSLKNPNLSKADPLENDRLWYSF